MAGSRVEERRAVADPYPETVGGVAAALTRC
jgi:hypothetical protein